MSKIQLNFLVRDIRKRTDNVIFSKWKGINYVRRYVKLTDAKTEGQLKVREAFNKLVDIWKYMGAPLHRGWNLSAVGEDFTGYNAFIGANVRPLRDNLVMKLFKSTGMDPIRGLSTSVGAQAGEVSIAFEAIPQGRHLTIFSHYLINGETSVMPVRHDMGVSPSSPTSITGLNQSGEYVIYGILSDAPYDSSLIMSESVGAKITMA